MNENQSCLIPRNLNKPDTISILKIELSLKQVGYLVLGATSFYFCFTSGLPLLIKAGLSFIGLNTSLICSFVTFNDSNVDELALNSLTYFQRKIYYRKMEGRGEMVVNIKSKKEPQRRERQTSF